MKKLLRCPPLFPAVFATGGWVAHSRWWPEAPLSATWASWIGGALLASFAGLAASAVFAFLRRKESPSVYAPTRKLVSAGIYAISRNPMYLSLLFLIAGLGSLLNALTVILAVIPAFVTLNWFTIPREEQYLKETLGKEYEEYLASSRRWI